MQKTFYRVAVCGIVLLLCGCAAIVGAPPVRLGRASCAGGLSDSGIVGAPDWVATAQHLVLSAAMPNSDNGQRISSGDKWLIALGVLLIAVSVGIVIAILYMRQKRK